MPAFEWVHVQLHQQKGMISLSPPTICNSARYGARYFRLRDVCNLSHAQITTRIKEGFNLTEK
ncbi:hypothetical protein C4Z07_017875 [Klebsiella pneumoniae subsp. pneumoniae]|nr:hypothetical protein BL137_00004910 [Klebsiella pneumoniae]ROC69228.1 hypothetical protein C4Z27_009120 [Klebsiella pneumoniae subsp. pneumoniae]RNP13510.1 hypothetical protein BL152_00023310 [Klebsiella pneumoniae]ROD53528.1 hypothetical protein C4Z10_013415 [Klebsiella pneumoniae subsp. pneumoniae]ROD66286.1 hypothetical protein C4Z07_017875 [Klebsiella pneumoniae subsp. pneumoniae]